MRHSLHWKLSLPCLISASYSICPICLRILQDLDATNGEDGDKSGIQDPDDAEESKDKERERESAHEKDRASAEEAKEDTPQVKCGVFV
jgi:hypothetical protein